MTININEYVTEVTLMTVVWNVSKASYYVNVQGNEHKIPPNKSLMMPFSDITENANMFSIDIRDQNKTDVPNNEIYITNISSICLISLGHTKDSDCENYEFSFLNCIKPYNGTDSVCTWDAGNDEKVDELNCNHHTLFNLTEFIWKHNPPYSKPNIEENKRIPKIYHFVWLSMNDQNNFKKEYIDNISTWITHNDQSEFILWTDCDLSEYEFPSKLQVKNKADIDNILKNTKSNGTLFQNLVKLYYSIPGVCNRSNLLRYVALYELGGIYVDINDFICIKSHEFLFDKFSFIASPEPGDMVDRETETKDGTIGCAKTGKESGSIIYMWNNALIASKPKHDILLGLIKASLMFAKETNIPKRIEESCSMNDANDFIYAVTGGVIFRKIINGFLMDPLKSKANLGILPSTFFYPCTFWYEKKSIDNTKEMNDMIIQTYVDNLPEQELWVKKESLSIHYNQNSYLSNVRKNDIVVTDNVVQEVLEPEVIQSSP
jgi:hypothetical protein